MFTGIVEEVGEIVAAESLDEATRFSIRAVTVLKELALGDSVAIDGVCLTVASMTAETFDVISVASTLSRTSLGGYAPARRVNLERALPLGGRLGGHLVQGHVDGVGELVAIEPWGESVLIDFTLPPDVSAVTVLHGSITLNGISLTVNALPQQGVAQVSIIPFTWSHTAIGELAVGDSVNLEGDLIGKYVRHLLGAPGRRGAEDLSGGWGY
ncbi:MAG: riboflavin synthase [Gemmatimonadetes bacterium]|nr:riboflavin synthase [Gemmatimonadota bacterium]